MALKTFTDLNRTLSGQPPSIGVLLSRIDIGKGREGLYLNQMPELLTSLAQKTRVESIRASTAIEGYEVDTDRADRLVREPAARVRNRNEQEFAGYRDAIDELMRTDETESVSVPLILHLHRRLYAHSGGRGGHFKQDDNAIVEYDDIGRRQLIFSPPPWQETPFLVGELVERYNAAAGAQAAHPLVLLAAFVLDFLAIHPMADGNGRLARLLTTQELLRNGYGVARYISVEQRIYENKHAYYQALRVSQTGWHQAEHSIWDWTQYLCRILADSYDNFERRIATARSTDGLSKQQIAYRHVDELAIGRQFRLKDLRAALPGISDPTFRLALRTLKDHGKARVDGTGQGAIWTRIAARASRCRC